MWEEAFNVSCILGGKAIPLPEDILALGKTQQWQPKDVILSNGIQIDKLYYIAEGRACLSLTHEEGSRRLLYIAEAGRFIGEAHFFYSSLNIGDFQAITPCRIVCFHKKLSRGLLESREEFRMALLYGLSHKALLYGTEILNMSYGSSPERLLALLRRLANEDEVHATQAEIAAMLGVHKVTINRLLKNLEEERRIRVCRNRIILMS